MGLARRAYPDITLPPGARKKINSDRTYRANDTRIQVYTRRWKIRSARDTLDTLWNIFSDCNYSCNWRISILER